MLVAGYDADVIAIRVNPSDDVSILADPANVTHVWKAGELVKSPAA
jgi:imidazolonepropionase-like amidohydrolase